MTDAEWLHLCESVGASADEGLNFSQFELIERGVERDYALLVAEGHLPPLPQITAAAAAADQASPAGDDSEHQNVGVPHRSTGAPAFAAPSDPKQAAERAWGGVWERLEAATALPTEAVSIHKSRVQL